MFLMKFAKTADNAAKHRLRAARSGFTFAGQRLWDERESAICHRLAPDYDALVDQIPGRTRSAIKSYCKRHRLCRPNLQWDKAKLGKLKVIYEKRSIKELLDAFPESNMVRLRAMATYHGFHRPRRRYKLTGHPQVDEIRAICFEFRITAKELDEFCGTTYFRDAHKQKNPNWYAVSQARRVLRPFLDDRKS